MNFQQVRFIIAVAETGSFTKAAEKCSVTQPALSSAISQFEDEIGGKIFFRTTRHVSLTELGVFLVEELKEILASRERLFTKAADFLARDEKTVRLGISPLISDDFVTTLLQRIQQVDRNLNVIITQMNKADIEPALLNGTIDFGLCPSPLVDDQFKSLSIYNEPLLYISNQLNNDGDQLVKLNDLAKKTFLLVQDDCGLAGAVRLLFRDHQVGLTEYEGRALSYNILEKWVRLDLGVTLLPASKVTDLSQACRIDDENGSFVSIGFQACWLETQEDRSNFKAMLESLSLPKASSGLT